MLSELDKVVLRQKEFGYGRASYKSDHVTGAFRDQNLEEGRGQNYQGSRLFAKCKAVRGKLSRVPLGCFMLKALNIGYFSTRALGNTIFLRENFYNFHPPTAS